ncbi:MAG: tol-pal system protein YbgF [Leptothrix ochracea]
MLSLWACSASQAGVFDDDEARKAINDLRVQSEQNNAQHLSRYEQLVAKMTEQSTQQTEQNAQLRRSLLELNNQIEQLRADVAKLRGQTEVTTQTQQATVRDLAETQRRMTDIQTSLDARLRQIEPQKVSMDGRDIVVAPEERKAYEDAMHTLRTDFGAAAQQLQAFQRRFPGSAYAGDVQYWLGNALYGKRDLKEAIVAYRVLVSTAPQHPRSPEALLQAATCQAELKDRKAAKITLDELIRLYPKSESAQTAKERLNSLKTPG